MISYSKTAVYRADISAEGSEEKKFYIGSSNNFKLRYARHKESFKKENLSTDTELAVQFWNMKSRGLSPIVPFKTISKPNADDDLVHAVHKTTTTT